MALTGKFLADFSDFYDACLKAEISVKSIGQSAGTVGPQLDKMVEQFSGKKVVSEAALMVRAVESIGGASQLSEADLKRVAGTVEEALGRMKRAAIPIPPEMQKLGDTTAAALADIEKAAKPVPAKLDQVGSSSKEASKSTSIMSTALGFATGGLAMMGVQMTAEYAIGFIRDIHASADALTKLSDKTGLTIGELQKFEVAGADAGNSIDDMARAVSAMQIKISGGDKSALAALQELGIGFDDFVKLSPAEQFIAVSDAIRKIDDPARAAKLAMDLMGKAGVENLPVLKRGFDDVKDGAVGMSETSIRAIDSFGDSVSAKTKWLKVQFGEAYADIITMSTVASRQMADAWNKQIADVARNAPKLAVAAPLVVPGLPDNIEAIWKAQDEQREAIDKTVEANKKAAKAQESYNDALRSLVDNLSGGGAIDKSTQYLQALDKTIPVQQMTRDKQDSINKVMGDALEAYRAMGVDAPQAIRDVYVATMKAVPVIEDLSKALAMLPQNVQGITLSTQQTVTALGTLPGKAATAISQTKSIFAGLGTSLASDLGKNVLAAIQGGGSVIATIGGTIGNTLLDPEKSGIGSAIAKGAAKLPGMIGGALNAVIPMVGSLIGPAIEMATKGIEKLFGRDEESKTVNPLRDKFVEAAGGIGELNKQAVAAGTTLDAMLKADTVDKYNTAIKDLQKAFDFQQQSLQLAVDTAKKYGFTLEELGPAMQRQELDKQAQQLYKDWEVLNAAGIDTVAITGRMSESVNTYLHQAMAMGTEVPEAMRPMLEAMAKQGELTDASGNKIENLEDSGVNFAMTMSDGFKKLIEGVEKLTDAISKGLGTAVDTTSKKITTMPKTVDVQVKYHDPGFTPSQAGAPVESYAEGSGGFRNFGAGTPVVLHGWEAVVPRDQASTAGPALLAGTGGGGGGPAVNIVINAQGALFDTPGDLQRLADRVNEALTAKFGLTHRMRAA